MQQQYEVSKKYVFRRIAPHQIKIKENQITPRAFHILPGMFVLSVFRCDFASPYQVLQECIEDYKKRLNDPDQSESENAAIWLAKNPDVESLVKKDWRVVVIPIEAILALGFDELEDPEKNGHINVIGTAEQFKVQAPEFVDLINTGQARILTVEECLERPDIK